jgi:ribose 5-phosphate isomerase A
MALNHVRRELARLGGEPVVRERCITDNGNLIVDLHGLEIADAAALESRINQIVGVVSNGLFARRPADVCLLASASGVQTLVAD